MKVKAEWLFYQGKSSFILSHGQKHKIETVSIDYCCRDMEISDAVRFGEWDSMLNRNSDVNISTCSPYPEGAVWDEEAINFCPFCGTKIEVEIFNMGKIVAMLEALEKDVSETEEYLSDFYDEVGL